MVKVKCKGIGLVITKGGSAEQDLHIVYMLKIESHNVQTVCKAVCDILHILNTFKVSQGVENKVSSGVGKYFHPHSSLPFHDVLVSRTRGFARTHRTGTLACRSKGELMLQAREVYNRVKVTDVIDNITGSILDGIIGTDSSGQLEKYAAFSAGHRG